MQARVPADVCKARLTALRKADGGLRGIARGDGRCRLVLNHLPLATCHSRELELERMPLQTTCVTPRHASACLGDTQRSRSGVSTSWAAFLGKLRAVGEGRGMLPFVRLFYYGSHPLIVGGTVQARCRDVSLVQYDALQQRAEAVHPDDRLVAFLDDRYVVTMLSRSRRRCTVYTKLVWHRIQSFARVVAAQQAGLQNWAMMCGEATSPMPNKA
ncbi:unnamed protein product [Symbiodinium natans]|uniref:Uncharacterized protein n=1 Tax=Symbiodinium natans TaxID=878477 RepID=A0A812SUZ5_9DINO|nr:unnamed protein product [Symbiodinium natans]